MSKWFFILLLLLIIPIADLFHPGLPLTHDGVDHIARIANFFINLQNGILIPRWAPNLNWGYGHPILEFLYPLPSYIASIFHFVGFSFIDSAKIVFGLGMVLSGITMYLWLSSFWTKRASFIGALLYVFAPYRFVELYVRGDIGENLAFVFVPLVLLFIHKLSQRQRAKHIIFGSLSLAGLILAHNAISLMFIPFILFYAGYEFYFSTREKKQFIYAFLTLFFLGFGLAAFFWAPALLEGKFTLRNIVTHNVYKSRFVTLQQLLYGPWSYGGTGLFTVQLGILQWVGIFISACLGPIFWIKKNKNFPLLLMTLFFTGAAIFLMLSGSDLIWSKILLLQNFQFPWRFLAITVFTTSILGALIVESLHKKLQLTVVAVIVVAILLLNMHYWHANGFIQKPASFFTGIYNGTTDTGESGPIWSVRFMEHRPSAYISVVSGKATIQVGKRSPTQHIYFVSAQGNVRLVENTLYFPGWEVVVDGQKVQVEFQDPKFRGLMTFFVPTGRHLVQIEFRENKLRLFSDFVSLLSAFIIIGIGIFRMRKK